jgi:uncharacterized lipoprotein
MKIHFVFALAIVVVALSAAGCSSRPAEATQEESKQSMDETLNFDPMAAGATGAPASTSP